VYSDLFHDGRLLSRGLGHFAIADLEPGLCGAVRSCTRLLSLCENRFFRNLARYTGGKQWSG
jgi:hypothetical protein